MVQYAPSPIQLKDVVLTLGADTFEKQVSQVLMTPNVSSSKWRGMSPGAVYGDTQWDYDLTITLAQDHESTGSLNEVLRSMAGTKQTFIFKPKSGGTRSYQVVATVVPPAIGGQVGAWAESSITMPCDGEPAVVTPGIPVPALANPATGGVAGGTMVTITGSNFAGATAVHFGTTAVPTADWTLVGPNLIVAKAPAQAAGSKPVKVTNASGQSTASAPFTYA